MKKFADIVVGQRFGRLVTIERFRKLGTLYWRCRCDCGRVVTPRDYSLKSKHSNSCGCLNKENVIKACTTHGMGKRGERPPEYHTWDAMIQRCTNPNNKFYSYYGGRGIKVCPRWLVSFAAFYADVGPRTSAKHTIDRLDSDGDYDPGNCAWRTREEQQHNHRITPTTGTARNGKNSWMSQAQYAGKALYLGTYKNREEAHFAYRDAKAVISDMLIMRRRLREKYGEEV